MIKLDEVKLRLAVIAAGGRVPPEIWNDLTPRDYAMIRKWDKKGWWEYGVSMRSGWLTPKGEKAMTEWFSTLAPGEGIEPPTG